MLEEIVSTRCKTEPRRSASNVWNRGRFGVAIACLALGISLWGCSGGASTGLGAPAAPAPTATPPKSGPPASVGQTVTLGAAQTVTLTPLASGASASVNFPATSSGQGPATISFQSTLPTGVPVPQSVKRRLATATRQSPQSLGAAVTPLAYIVVTPSSPLIFRATPAFTFTFPAGVLAGYAYVAFFDPVNPQLGWNTLLGPVQANGTSTTFASQLDDSPPLALGANTGYVFALVQNATALPTPPPAPYGITEYAVPNGVSAGLTNGMTKGPDGNIWFTENLNDNIDKITTSGVVTQYPLPASVYEGPQGIAAGPDGNLWFAEYANATIGKITPGGVITEYPLPTAGSGPVNIAAGPDGNLWFTEYLSNAIGKITPSGVVTECPLPVTVRQASFNPGPFGITAGADGNLWFADSNFASTGGNSIGKITPSGVITNYPIPTANALTIGIAVGPDGNVWFVENLAKQIGKITPAGVVTEYPVTYSTVSLQEIVAGADGNLWVSDQGQNHIFQVTTSGVNSSHHVPTPNAAPNGIIAGPDGNIWFTEPGAGQIGKLLLP